MDSLVGSAGAHQVWGMVKLGLVWVMTLIGVITLSQLVLAVTLVFSVFQLYKVILEIKKLQRDEAESRKRIL